MGYRGKTDSLRGKNLTGGRKRGTGDRWQLTPLSSACALRLDEEAAGERVAHQCGTAVQIELLHDARAVGLDALRRERQLLGDLTGRVPKRD